jgi:hypothetical protein
MKKNTSEKADKKKWIVLFSLLAAAVIGLAIALASSSTFSVSPFLLAAVGSGSNRVVVTEYPSSVTLGTMVTIKGRGFTRTDNRVHIGEKQVNNVRSFENGTIIVFEVPSEKDLTTGTYKMFVRNSRGTSNTVSITLTNPNSPTIISLSPSSGPVGTVITITGTGFLPNANQVYFGPDIVLRSVASSDQGKKITYKVTQLAKNCDPKNKPIQGGCGQSLPKPYAVSVQNSNGKSNEAIFTVTR